MRKLHLPPLPPPRKKALVVPRSAPETPQQRIDRLQAELQKAQEAQKLENERQATIVGAVVVRHAATNMDFHRQLAAILRTEVKAKADLAAIASLLTDPPVPK
jgi:hypothetical protein